MDLNRLIDRLDLHPERRIATLGPDAHVRYLSFAELRRRIEHAMATLRARGVTSGMRIGLMAENCVEWIIYDVALLTMGCTTVAFPRELVTAGLRQVFDRFDLSLMLLSAEETLSFKKLDGRVHLIDADTPWTEPALPARTPRAAEPFTPTLIFSSGSSGRIKCLVCDLDGVAYDIEQFYKLFDIRADDRLLIFLPFSHFQQRVCSYAAIWYGLDIALVRPHQVFDAFQRLAPTLCLAPPLLYETIYTQFLNRLDQMPRAARLGFRVLSTLATLATLAARLPPGRARRLAQRLAYGEVERALGGSMRLMWTGMAPIKRDVIDFFWHAGIPLYEAYGMEEAGIIASNAPGAYRPGSVGKPLAETTITLAEDGEVMVWREHFGTSGYLDPEDDLQSMTFRASGHIATGDNGRFDSDGFLYLIGRKKEIIVTSSGHKIHPERVEAELNQHTLVERAAVIDAELPYLVAVIVPRVELSAEVEDAIRAHVQTVNSSLGTGLQIGRVVFSDVLFSAENGLLTRTLKLDRRAIKQRFDAEIRGLAGPRTGRRGTPGAPLTETERKLISIWRQVLVRDRIGTRDHFFDAGGDSLQAMQLIQEIAVELDVRLPLEAMLAYPTVESLARHIDQPHRDMRSLLVPIRPEGSRPPIYCIHPLNGGVMCYAELAARLDDDQPVYGIRARGIMPGERPLGTVADMVAAHIEEILAVQPTGPYRLGGWSLGGLFATATARALARLGHTVERVFLLDTWLPLDTTSDIAEQEDMVYRMILHPWLRDPDDVDRISLPWRRGDDHEKKERLLVDFVCTDKRFQPHLERGEVERLLNVQMALLRAESEFTSAPCEVPLLYIHATVMPQQEHDSQRVQSHDCVVVHIDCGHGECVKMPYVAQIAAAIDGSYEPPA